MTAPLFSGRGRRSVAALGAVSAGLLVLSACDKPTPLATVTVGTSSVSAEATCLPEGDAKELSAAQLEKCLSPDSKDIKSVDYRSGDTLRLGVEPEIVEGGKKWLAVAGTQSLGELTDNTYQSFRGMNPFATGGQAEAPSEVPVHIAQFGESGKPIAIWSFNLKRK
ncbi:DUF2771 domain-containing protein [Streptomyces antimicrobicus]|uniref:DUF2771 domain-containing protein n=1 Tax=Streptomyces antimicrobicus TaxID=2883108 RepID=A0ABS8B169_9ACTN|nr:DUF2771 domain-containing protein [Streptomyces antimicrobicus]MCB5178358.1 DUF2771 domain-containing protein [Streptomyces antimicrobicus]